MDEAVVLEATETAEVVEGISEEGGYEAEAPMYDNGDDWNDVIISLTGEDDNIWKSGSNQFSYTAEYAGKNIKPTVKLSGGSDFETPTDYTEEASAVSFENKGDYTITIKPVAGAGLNDKSDLVLSFKITAFDLSTGDRNTKVEASGVEGQQPTIEVKTNAGNLTSDDYTVALTKGGSSIEASAIKANDVITVTVTAKEESNFTGSASGTYTATASDVVDEPTNKHELVINGRYTSDNNNATFPLTYDIFTIGTSSTNSNPSSLDIEFANRGTEENPIWALNAKGNVSFASKAVRVLQFNLTGDVKDAKVTVKAESTSTDGRKIALERQDSGLKINKNAFNTDESTPNPLVYNIQSTTKAIVNYEFFIDAVDTSKAYGIAMENGLYIYSVTVEENYSENAPLAVPEADPADGTAVLTGRTIELSSKDGDAVSIYWADGANAPNKTENKYDVADKYSDTHKPTITGEAGETKKITAIAVKEAADRTVEKESNSVTFTYTITDKETINLVTKADKAFGVYDGTQTVTLSVANADDETNIDDATIYYTTDGKNPKNTTSNVQSVTGTATISVSTTTTIKAYATKEATTGNEYVDSEIATFRYIIKQSHTEDQTYVANPTSDNEPIFDLETRGDSYNYTPPAPSEGFVKGDEYGVGTNDYFKLMYDDNNENKAAVRDMTVLGDASKLGISSANYYTIADLTTSWNASDLKTLVGDLNENVKAISLLGGGVATYGNDGAKKVGNAIRIDVASPAEVTVYYSGKVPGDTEANKKKAAKIAVYPATTADDTALGTQLADSKITGNTATNNDQIGKAVITLDTAGSYYNGFDANGGIIPYIKVVEKSNSTSGPGENDGTVATPALYTESGSLTTASKFNLGDKVVLKTTTEGATLNYSVTKPGSTASSSTATEQVTAGTGFCAFPVAYKTKLSSTLVS